MLGLPSSRNPSLGVRPGTVEPAVRPPASQSWNRSQVGRRESEPAREDELSTGEIIALHGSFLLNSFASHDLSAFLASAAIRRLTTGEILFREDDPPGNSIWLIAAGVVRIDVASAAGKDMPVRKLKPGHHFGEIGFLGGQPHSATVVAIAPTKLVELDHRAVSALISRDPRVERALRRSYHRRALSPEEVAARGGIDALL